jgi:hypothetical protein
MHVTAKSRLQNQTVRDAKLESDKRFGRAKQIMEKRDFDCDSSN